MEELPSHIMVDILIRLPVKTLIHCNCVCKSWRDLVSDSHFANIHLSRSTAGLMIHHTKIKDVTTDVGDPGVLRWVEIKDELNHQRVHHDPVMSLDLAPVFRKAKLLHVGSVDGLMCLWEFAPTRDNTYVCNPITREYISLPKQKYKYQREGHASIIYGFGVGSQTKEYKVIRTFQKFIPPEPFETYRNMIREAEVYTLGTGQWRSLGHVPYWLSGGHGAFLNGNAHWFLIGRDSPEKLCTFNIDKETFQLFPSRPRDDTEDSEIHYQSLTVLKGCLCESYTSIMYEEITIWVMKEYGVKSSWHKEVVIANPGLDWLTWDRVYPVERLHDGSILMVFYEHLLFEYCPETKSIEEIEMFKPYFSCTAYLPSFLKLERFESERVQVF